MYKEQLTTDRLPEHVAIIMDGNGRWAKKQGLARVFGHQKGVETVHEITTAAAELGLKYLTLYTFSTENWNRPQEEVDAIMTLLVETIAKERPTLMTNNVRLLTVGDTDHLPADARKTYLQLIEDTAGNTGLSLVLALSYSSRWEITEATKRIARKIENGELKAEDITEQTLTDNMTTAAIPDPDLLIRTSGEYRISNFLLWQLAYSEMYFTDCYWPEFTREEFYKALVDYAQRERRFGKTSEQIQK